MINEYLQQLQESSIPIKWRQRVEVYILKDDKLIVGFKNDLKLYMPPGGGVEKGQTLYTAAEEECLEELGVKIKNPTLIVKDPYRVDWYKLTQQGVNIGEKQKNRMKDYRGQEIYFLKAYFDRVDMSKYEHGNSSMKPVVISKERLIKELKKNNLPISRHRIKIIGML